MKFSLKISNVPPPKVRGAHIGFSADPLVSASVSASALTSA